MPCHVDYVCDGLCPPGVAPDHMQGVLGSCPAQIGSGPRDPSDRRFSRQDSKERPLSKKVSMGSQWWAGWAASSTLSHRPTPSRSHAGQVDLPGRSGRGAASGGCFMNLISCWSSGVVVLLVRLARSRAHIISTLGNPSRPVGGDAGGADLHETFFYRFLLSPLFWATNASPASAKMSAMGCGLARRAGQGVR